jgi:hypothetical protein
MLPFFSITAYQGPILTYIIADKQAVFAFLHTINEAIAEKRSA